MGLQLFVLSFWLTFHCSEQSAIFIISVNDLWGPTLKHSIEYFPDTIKTETLEGKKYLQLRRS